jgi:hypothetical protein
MLYLTLVFIIFLSFHFHKVGKYDLSLLVKFILVVCAVVETILALY